MSPSKWYIWNLQLLKLQQWQILKKLLPRRSLQWQKENCFTYFDLILAFHKAVVCIYLDYVKSKCLRHLISINNIQHWTYRKRLSFSIYEWINSTGGRWRSLFYDSYQCWSYWSKDCSYYLLQNLWYWYQSCIPVVFTLPVTTYLKKSSCVQFKDIQC